VVAWKAGIRIFSTRNLIAIGPFVLSASPRRSRRLRTRLALAAALAAVAGLVWAERVPATPYNRIAQALVAEGWRSNDPVALFGGFFSFRSPLEWYLPHDPPLALAQRQRAACRTVFVVVGPARKHALMAEPRATRRRIGRYLVARLALRAPMARDPFLRRAIVLTDPVAPAPCVRAVSTGRFSASWLG
jgi:hypothetical protein